MKDHNARVLLATDELIRSGDNLGDLDAIKLLDLLVILVNRAVIPTKQLKPTDDHAVAEIFYWV